MLGKNGTYVLIFFLLLWSGFIGYFVYYQHQQKDPIVSRVDADYSTKPYTNEELKDLARLERDSVTAEDAIQQDFSLAEKDIQNDSTNLEVVHAVVFDDTEYFVHQTYDQHNLAVETHSEEQDLDIPTQKEQQIKNTHSELTWYSPEGFVNLYNVFENTHERLNFLNKYIYNIKEVDDYIKEKAEQRGYRQRGFAFEDEIIKFENIQTRPEVRDAYVAMRNEMLKQDIKLHFVSGYRSSTHQRSIFKEKMNSINPNEIPGGSHDDHLNTVLSRSALPGYSKHHSGYAADFGCGNDYLVFAFAQTPCYEWMSAGNFANARKYGFIPSYPEGAANQGPNPEPWEYVWVGAANAQ